ncbi:thiamine phosphate synthase [Lentilactobacillus sp. SPB1-3]|uniref:Thiamine phosphate synthase n=1 Tax=Lentilactobacillus terminaliae TaxID=3003483 RepID=A0ACD5DF52_9LACO|nr:thiamine phosphate synthase [Lentilactobacillus sp. SPB1-3]MCZ0977475.1 thiamine phosphate synthase [Lentilactobacillus sp. SPB1-3]
MTMKFKRSMLTAYFICGTQDIKDATKTLPSVLTEALEAGITAFQFREKGTHALTGDDKLAMAKQLQQLCAQYQVPFIVDDDVALARQVKADGIHVGQKDERINQVIAEIGQQMFIGLSCNTIAQVQAANQLSELAYLGSGPVFPTQSKDDADPVIGTDGIAELVKYSQYPIVAIGGISENNVAELAHTGVAGSSVISVIAQSTDIRRTVKRLKKINY